MSAALTVLMPVYNSEKFLAQAINSILAQTFTDFEFLIINDASTDGSVSVIESFSDPRIRLLHNTQNLGIAATLDKGIAVASSDYIARMDADDICHPQRLEKQFRFMKENPDVAMVSCWTKHIDEEGRAVHEDLNDPDHFYYFMTYVCSIYHPSVLYKKTAVEKVGGYRKTYAEDFTLFCDLLRSFPVGHLKEILLNYRISSQSLHRVTKKKEYDEAEREQVMNNIRQFTGEESMLTQSQLDCLRYQFEDLLKEGSVDAIKQTIVMLDETAQRIAGTPHINCRPHKVLEAAGHHKAFILSYFLRNLSRTKALRLAAATSSWPLLLSLAGAKLRSRSAIRS